MEITMTYDVTDCRDCPFANSYYGHGECWEECTHKENGRGAYEDILWGCQQSFAVVPEWCPIGLGGTNGNNI